MLHSKWTNAIAFFFAMEWGTEIEQVCPPIIQTKKGMSVLVHFVESEDQMVDVSDIQNHNVKFVAIAITNKKAGDNVVVLDYADVLGKDSISFQTIADKYKKKLYVDFDDVFFDEAHKGLQRWQKEIIDNELEDQAKPLFK